MHSEIFFRPLASHEVGIWRRLHAEDEGMMYPLPATDDLLWRRLECRRPHLVCHLVDVVGCFSLVVDESGIASGGFLVARAFRGRGFGKRIVAIQEDLARGLGAHSIRHDVFADNASSLSLLKALGYRPFVWLEKPLR